VNAGAGAGGDLTLTLTLTLLHKHSDVQTNSPLRRCPAFSVRVSLGKFRHDLYNHTTPTAADGWSTCKA